MYLLHLFKAPAEKLSLQLDAVNTTNTELRTEISNMLTKHEQDITSLKKEFDVEMKHNLQNVEDIHAKVSQASSLLEIAAVSEAKYTILRTEYNGNVLRKEDCIVYKPRLLLRIIFRAPIFKTFLSITLVRI